MHPSQGRHFFDVIALGQLLCEAGHRRYDLASVYPGNILHALLGLNSAPRRNGAYINCGSRTRAAVAGSMPSQASSLLRGAVTSARQAP